MLQNQFGSNYRVPYKSRMQCAENLYTKVYPDITFFCYVVCFLLAGGLLTLLCFIQGFGESPLSPRLRTKSVGAGPRATEDSPCWLPAGPPRLLAVFALLVVAPTFVILSHSSGEQFQFLETSSPLAAVRNDVSVVGGAGCLCCCFV
jgi:hypothetical protein